MAVALEVEELLVAEEYVVLAVDFAVARQACRARHGAHVDVLAYGLLELVVERGLLKALVQIGAQLERQQEHVGQRRRLIVALVLLLLLLLLLEQTGGDREQRDRLAGAAHLADELDGVVQRVAGHLAALHVEEYVIGRNGGVVVS